MKMGLSDNEVDKQVCVVHISLYIPIVGFIENNLSKYSG